MIRNILLKIACKILNYYNTEILDTKLNKVFIFNNKLFEVYSYEYKQEFNSFDELKIRCRNIYLPK